MKTLINRMIMIVFAGSLMACEDFLDQAPVDQITDNIAIIDEATARTALGGLYRRFTPLSAGVIIAGDFMSDNLKHNGTFADFSEMDNKILTTANGQVQVVYDQIYATAYVANFILEEVPQLQNVSAVSKNEITGTARFFRAYAYFSGVNMFGDIPFTNTSSVVANRSLPRTNKEVVLDSVEADLLYAIGKLPNSGGPYFITNGAAKALLARLYLYRGEYANALNYAEQVIDGDGTPTYTLTANFTAAIAEASSEAILECNFTVQDNPGTNNNFGLYNLFAGRREIIPSDDFVSFITTGQGGRSNALSFNANQVNGRDNGYTIARYNAQGSNTIVIRLSEMHLIKAEALAQTNLPDAITELNLIRSRSIGNNPAPLAPANLDEFMDALLVERRAEFAFEGHRWFDLKRTDKADEVMNLFTPNWNNADYLFPIPQQEIQNNPGISPADQNPGYN